MAEAEDGQHDHQLEVAAADIRDHVGDDGLFQALGTGDEKKPEVHDGNQGEQKRDMNVIVFMPHEHIDACQDDRNDKGGEVISVNHGSSSSGFSGGIIARDEECWIMFSFGKHEKHM